MKDRRTRRPASGAVLRNVLLAMVGVALALALVEVLMRIFPNWVPAEVRVNPPVRREKAFIDESYDLRQSDGDLNYYMRGSIAPSSSDQVVAHVHMLTDENGFRNSPPEKASYSIVALGDSFTRGSGVAAPWPQKLAEIAGTDALNLGDVGLGPQDELTILRQYGLKKQPHWVILAYFEGNDLYDAASYEQANPFIMLRFGKYMLGRGLAAWQQSKSDGAQAAPLATYRYPISITIAHREIKTVFFSSYISWLSVSRESIAASQNYRLVKDTILQVQQSSEARGAIFLLVYVPSKEHIYLPYVSEPHALASIYSDVPAIDPDQAGFLRFASEKATPGLVRQHMGDQAARLAAFSAENHIHFLDLTPAFQEEASAGVGLYYTYDTHWNQLGHDLAAETIYDFMQRTVEDTASKTPVP